MLYEFSQSPDPWDNLTDELSEIETTSVTYANDEPEYWYQPAAPTARGVDGVALTAVLLIILLGGGLLLNRRPAAAASETAGPTVQETVQPAATAQTNSLPDTNPIQTDDSRIISPYDEATLTQGLHGYSYGHMAIDLAAGEGSVIKSPIAGKVTERYVDEYNNTVLVIENKRYQVTLMHGDYTVRIGDELTLGTPVGTEGNNGYTKDSFGNVCNGRAGCGHHTHLNIFDKQQQTNVNPLRFFTLENVP